MRGTDLRPGLVVAVQLAYGRTGLGDPDLSRGIVLGEGLGFDGAHGGALPARWVRNFKDDDGLAYLPAGHPDAPSAPSRTSYAVAIECESYIYTADDRYVHQGRFWMPRMVESREILGLWEDHEPLMEEELTRRQRTEAERKTHTEKVDRFGRYMETLGHRGAWCTRGTRRGQVSIDIDAALELAGRAVLALARERAVLALAREKQP